MCPTWGVVHNQRKYPTEARSMALEAGSTMHEVYAAMRIYQLGEIQGFKRHALETAKRVFSKDAHGNKANGAKRWKNCIKLCTADDEVEYMQQLAFAVLHSSGWVDNDNDAVRTMTNMEMSAIYYIHERYPFMHDWPIYVENPKDPKCLVGIEQVFDVVLTYEDGWQRRFCGTIDGLVKNLSRDKMFLEENKTASRLDDGWKFMFQMSHQVTGYLAITPAMFGMQVWSSRIIGAKVKPTQRGEDVYTLEAHRNPATVVHWASWFRHSVEMYETFQDDWENAPRYTHSCNRFFRPCSLISFCCDTPEGRKHQWSQMVSADLSPSERAVTED